VRRVGEIAEEADDLYPGYPRQHNQWHTDEQLESLHPGQKCRRGDDSPLLLLYLGSEDGDIGAAQCSFGEEFPEVVRNIEGEVDDVRDAGSSEDRGDCPRLQDAEQA
jgi:hypothetical protein